MTSLDELMSLLNISDYDWPYEAIDLAELVLPRIKSVLGMATTPIDPAMLDGSHGEYKRGYYTACKSMVERLRYRGNAEDQSEGLFK